MNKNDIIEKLNKLSDKYFIEIIRNSEQRIKIIEKKENLVAAKEKFEKKGVQCPDCDSFQCIKNGTKDYKQRYRCKSCNITFHAFKKHYLLLKPLISWPMRFINKTYHIRNICL